MSSSARGPARRLGGKVVRWMHRSGHRTALTNELGPTVEAMTGLVLDIGGGTDSPLARSFTGLARRVRVDVEPVPPPDVAADAALLPVRSGVADAVLMSEVLEHVADPWSAVAEVHRVLRPGGRFVGSVPFMCQGIHADPHDYYRYTETALRAMLGEFVDVEVIAHGNGFGVAWRMVVGRCRWLMPINPLMRQISRWTDEQYAEGYVFSAVKPA